MYRLAEQKNRKNASVWYTAKPGVSDSGKSRPQISGILELSPEQVQMVIDHGPIEHDQMLQMRFSAWKNEWRKSDKAPSHRGLFEFSQEQMKEFKKSA